MSINARPPAWLLALFLAALTAPFWSLSHSLVEVDDARYAEVPREMAAAGDWATPHLNGMDYVEKPPLWYWLCAGSDDLFGASEASGRFALACLALLGLMGIFWLGSWTGDRETGLLATVILSTCSLYFFLSHYITPDMAVSVFLLWTSAMILRVLMRPDDGRWASPLAWLLAALAFLSKGLIALVFPAGWAIFLALAFPSFRKGFKALFNPLGIALFLLVAAPWFILMERRHPGFLHFFFTEQHFQRFLSNHFDRHAPWYFFLMVVPVGLLPWTAPCLFGFVRSLTKLDEPVDFALAWWAAIIIGFFSLSHSKLTSYALPLAPHLALLGARSMTKTPPHWSVNFARAGGLLMLVAVIALPWAARTFPEINASLNRPTLMIAMAAAALWGCSLLAFGRKHSALVLGFSGLLVGAMALVALSLDAAEISAKNFAAQIETTFKPGDRIDCFRSYLQGIPFYTRHPVDRLIDLGGMNIEDFKYAAREPQNAGRFGDLSALKDVGRGPGADFVILKNADAKTFWELTPGDHREILARNKRWMLVRASPTEAGR